jgi:hypothetical protein
MVRHHQPQWCSGDEARLQGRRGPRVLQPHYDLAKVARPFGILKALLVATGHLH